MKKYQTNIISKAEMEKYLSDCVENPLSIMKEAIKSKTSIYSSIKIKSGMNILWKGAVEFSR